VNAAIEAHELGANCFQIFSSSPRIWRASVPSPEQCRLMRAAREKYDLAPLVIHDSYLINLASADETVRQKSIEAFRGELVRAVLIGADYLVIHPGGSSALRMEEAVMTLVESLEKAARGLTGEGLTLLLENTAGGGNRLGKHLEELRVVHDLAQPRFPFAIGYCLDTCHLYAAGHDISTGSGLAETLRRAEIILGLDNVPVIHTNDSKGALNSHLDRHANIGEGLIGLDGFRRIINHPKLRSKAFILETPCDNEGDDRREIERVRSLIEVSGDTRQAAGAKRKKQR